MHSGWMISSKCLPALIYERGYLQYKKPIKGKKEDGDEND
jgi:hypothetical protein